MLAESYRYRCIVYLFTSISRWSTYTDAITTKTISPSLGMRFWVPYEYSCEKLRRFTGIIKFASETAKFWKLLFKPASKSEADWRPKPCDKCFLTVGKLRKQRMLCHCCAQKSFRVINNSAFTGTIAAAAIVRQSSSDQHGRSGKRYIQRSVAWRTQLQWDWREV